MRNTWQKPRMERSTRGVATFSGSKRRAGKELQSRNLGSDPLSEIPGIQHFGTVLPSTQQKHFMYRTCFLVI